MISFKVTLLTDDGALRRTLVGRVSVSRAVFSISGRSAIEAASDKERIGSADFILLDASLPDRSAPECIARLRARGARCKIILLAQPHQMESVVKAFQAGADGCFPRDESPEALCKFLLDFRHGGAPIPPRVVKWIVSHYQKNTKNKAPVELLTPRENQIFDLLAKGFSDKQIARHLAIAQTTVNDHLKSIYRKLGVHSRAEAVASHLSRG